MAEAVRAGGTVSSDILSHSLLAEAARAGGTSLFGNPVRDAGACRDCASPAVSVPEVRHYPRLFRNKKVPQAMLTELFALQDGLEPTTP